MQTNTRRTVRLCATAYSNMKGATLIELMLALFISTLILSSLISIYVATQSIQQTQIALTTLVENSNSAFYFLTADFNTGKKNKIQPYESAEIKAGSMAFTVQHADTKEINTYFISKTKRKDLFDHVIYALYRLDQQYRKTELVEGVDDMKIQYTVADNNKITECSAKELTDRSKIIGISIMLRLTSLNIFPLQKNEYIYAAI